MSNFFDSEIIQNELQEIDNLQKEICASIFSLGSATNEDKLEHIEKLQILLEKQKIMNTRLSLSDDPKAIELKEQLKSTLPLFGFSSDMDMNVLFDDLSKSIETLKEYLSK